MAGLQPEKVADVDQGSPSDIEVGGMTAEEQAAFDAMRTGERDADGRADPESAGGEVDADGDADADADAAAAAAGADGTADAGAADGTGGEGRAPPKTISYGKYQREQKKLQAAHDALQAQLDGSRLETKKEREDRLRLDERTKMLLEAINTKPKSDSAAAAVDADPEPSKDEDPIGHLEWRNRKLEKTVSDLQSGRQKEVEQNTAQNEEKQVLDFFTSDLEREAQADPTFAPAFVHLRESRYTELGYIFAGIDINDKAAVDANLTPEQQIKLSADIQRSFHNEQLLVAREAISKKISPAKVVANLARARGYKPAAAPDAAAVAAAAAAAGKKNGNGAVVPAAAAPKSVTEELGAIREGLAAAKSLSDAGGAPGGTITPQRMVDMDDDEFLDYVNHLPKRDLDRLMGKVPQ